MPAGRRRKTAAITQPEGYLVSGGLPGTDHRLIRHRLAGPDPRGEGALIWAFDLDAQSEVPAADCEMRGAADRIIGHGKDRHLNWGEPRREGTAMHLDEVGDEPFHAADDAAVHHDRTVPIAIGAYVVQAEPLRLVEVDLNGGQAGLTPGGVGDLDVDLGTVEGRLAVRLLILQAGRLENVAQQTVRTSYISGLATYLAPAPAR